MLNLAEANALLSTITTSDRLRAIDELRALIGQLDVSVDGSITVLYSGNFPDGTKAESAALNLAMNRPEIRIINNSQAAKFLDFENNPAFASKLEELFGPDYRNRGSAANRFLFGTFDDNGVRITADGAWDDVSKRFAQGAVGDVRVIAPEASRSGIFGTTELPELLKDTSKVTHIDGVPIEQIRAYSAANGLDGPGGLKQFIFDQSYFKTHLSGLATGDLSRYLDFPPPDQYTEILKDPNRFKLSYDSVEVLRADGRLASFNDNFRRAYLAGEDLVQRGIITKAANKLGPLGLAATLLIAANSASAAEAAGDSEGAKQIIREWALDAAGSFAGEIIGAAVGGIALAALGAVGVVFSAPVAGALVLAAAITGGIFGADAAKEIYELTKDKDNNGKRDLFDKLTNLLYGATYTITSPLPADLNGERLTLNTGFSREQLVANAKTNIAWRYALRELNPFVIPDIDYSRHNTDGSLDLYDPATGRGVFTELYLQDRAAFLTWRLRFDKLKLPYNRDLVTNEVFGNYDFVDYSNRLAGGAPLTLAIDGIGISLYDHQIVFGGKDADSISGSGDSDHLYGGAGDDNISGGDGNDYIEGQLGNDNLKGEAGRDTLIGGLGDDTLDGGASADRLEGGLGNDTYRFSSSEQGNDVIRDFDGSGKIVIDSTILSGGEAGEVAGTWQRGEFTYSFNPGSGGRGNLYITSAVGRITVENFANRELGINLVGAPEVSPPPPADRIIVGDLSPIDFDPATPGVQVRFDDIGNVITDPSNPDPGRADILFDSTGNDKIDAYSGNDVIRAFRGGNDTIDGFAGDDIIEAGAGNDSIDGNTEDDYIKAGAGGNDLLFGDAELDSANLDWSVTRVVTEDAGTGGSGVKWRIAA